MKPLSPLFSSFGTTVFHRMSQLARQHDAINLGQGFPDDPGPEDVRRAAAEYVVHGNNQYPSMMGLDGLRQAVAAHDRRFYDLDIDWQTEVMVTSGATEAVACCLLGLLAPGDEAVLFEPLYDTYLPIVRMAGAVPRVVRLQPPAWRLPADLASYFSSRTKVVLVNSPMNPSAKVFTDEELQQLAALTLQHDAYAVCDEVYEHLLFDGLQHRPLITYPRMRDRAVRIGSAGKTFSITGWKIGYITAPAPLLSVIAKVHQFICFATPPALQHAVALGLGKTDDYFSGLAKGMQRSRDRLAAALAALDLPCAPCQGSYFLTADFSAWGTWPSDEAFCDHLVREARVAAVPVSAFYEADPPHPFVRFAFCKGDETLDEAARRLRAHRAVCARCR